MPATFQKAMDFTLNNFHSAAAFLDDIIIITKGSIEDHENEIDKVLYELDKKLAISLQKWQFLQTEIIWLGYKISPNRIIPTEKKTNATAQMEPSHTLK